MALFTVRDIDAILQNGPQSADDYSMMRARITQIIICRFLDPHTMAQLFGPERIDRRYEAARRFIRMDDVPDSEDVQVLRTSRLVWLAEGLLNLQRCVGFEKILNDIKNGDFQAAWEEVAFGGYFAQSGITVEFLKASQTQGQKTADFKVSWNGCEVHCEVEGKQEATTSTFESTRNTLEHARKQLPKNSPGIVCFKVPEAWKGPERLDPVFAAIRKFLSRTDRIVGVLLRSERQAIEEGETSALKLMMRNPTSKMLDERVSVLLDRTSKFDRPQPSDVLRSDLLALDENSTELIPLWIPIDIATRVICQTQNTRAERLGLDHRIIMP